jgi:hypothetical protein
MLDTSITHLKVFLQEDGPNVALFTGPDENSDWSRNVSAKSVLRGLWSELPLETLVSVDELKARGLLLAEEPPAEEASSLRSAWALRAAGLAARQAVCAADAQHPDLESECCTRVVRCLEQAQSAADDGQQKTEIQQKRTAWLFRAVEATLNAWNKHQDPQLAERLALLFADLATAALDDEPTAREQAHQNHRFWSRQAAAAWSGASLEAEQKGDLERAEAHAQAVLRVLNNLAA